MILDDMIKKCHLHGNFRLSNGGQADEYFDLAPLFLNYFGLTVLCKRIDLALIGVDFKMMACYEMCPVPLLGAYCSKNPLIEGLIVRKQNKGHGTDKLIEGNVVPGCNVVVIEDVVSSGASVIKAINALEYYGCKIVAVVAIINRQEGCDELLKGYNLKSLFLKSQLIS